MLEVIGAADSVSLSRQGPPDQRDLILDLRGVTSTASVPPTASTGGDPLVPFRIESAGDDSARSVRLVVPLMGDSLVRFEQGPGGLSLLLIPPAGKGRAAVAGAYRVGADDVLAISVFGHEDLTKTSKVSPDGLINFPLIGNVSAAGRTVDEIGAEIQERLGADFLVEPHVTVSVWEYLSQWVNVVGEVAKPGRYYMTGPTTLVDAVSMAGGLTPKAGATILVTRRLMESDPAEAGRTIRFDTSAMLGMDEEAARFRLRPGDVVNVPERESAGGAAR
jgi:protein involved in polysaccharide export with SLBB domain